MANISISDLPPAGTDLLLDSESYINKLTNDDSYIVEGGGRNSVVAITATVTSPACAVGAAIFLPVAVGVGAAMYAYENNKSTD